MEHRIGNNTEPDERLRLKKALQFIREVVRDYGTKEFDHVSFSYALAVSKAEELAFLVTPVCPVREAFQGLSQSMKRMPLEPAASSEAERYLERIFGYFSLDQIFFAPH